MPVQTAALRIADTVAGWAGLHDRRFNMAALVRRARRETGLTEFGEVDYAPALGVLLDACARESALSVIGRSATAWDVVRFLSNLLRLQAAESADPGIRQQPIRQPIFITGLPRSGTTFLHRLMMADPASRAPLVWEAIHPCAPPGSAARRIAQVNRQLGLFERLAPEFRSLHPLEATSPQECSEINAHVFRSLRFDSNYFIPSYRAWLEDGDAPQLDAYRFHRRFLQHLQHQGGQPRQWVLKCPEHVFALSAIRAVYPDARLVFVHRDPVKVLLSVARLTEVLRRPFTRRLDPLAIGRGESARWLEGTQRMIEAGEDAGFGQPICHVHHTDLIGDPLATVERVYRHFGMPLSDAAIEGMTGYVAQQPDGGYGRHTYRFEDHGLDQEIERERFRPYMLRFGIAAEPVSSGAGRSRPVPHGQPAGATAG